MQRLGMEEGQEIESPMVTKAIASAQKRVEGSNFEIRKHLLEYDDVMNSQREFIYRERDEILHGEDISYKFSGIYPGRVQDKPRAVHRRRKSHPEEWDMEGLQELDAHQFRVRIGP